MKILVVGANVQTGRHLIKYILESKQHQARALLLNKVQEAYFKDMGVESIIFDFKQKKRTIAVGSQNVDAVVYIGSRFINETDTLNEIDETINIMEAIRHAGVKRLVHLSTFETSKEEWSCLPSFYRPTLIEKYYVNHWLRASSLDYTIIHAGTLNDKKGSGLIKVAGLDLERGEISREDVAKVILTCLENDFTIRKEFKLVSGKVPIQEALDFKT